MTFLSVLCVLFSEGCSAELAQTCPVAKQTRECLRRDEGVNEPPETWGALR